MNAKIAYIESQRHHSQTCEDDVCSPGLVYFDKYFCGEKYLRIQVISEASRRVV